MQIRYHIPLQILSREKECFDGKPAKKKRCKNSLSSLLSILLRKLAQKKFWSYACNCCYPTQFAHLAVQAVCMKKRLQKVIIVPRLVTRSLPSVPVNNCRSLKIEHRQIDGSGFISALLKKYHTSYFIMRLFFRDCSPSKKSLIALYFSKSVSLLHWFYSHVWAYYKNRDGD